MALNVWQRRLTKVRVRGAGLAVAVLVLLASNARELIFLLGLVLLASGVASMVSTAAALVVSGAILVWLAVPPRKNGNG